ncbi:MAG TPA: hypothetical protein VK348_12270 [Planctomycetota bacterium]|nr:hypothetical protein [Planctomycetota bacterium]
MLRRSLLVVAVACQSCFTAAVWGDYGCRTESFQAHATFAVTTVATLEPSSLVVQGRQLTGQLAPELLERLGTAPWLVLQPDAGADAALAMLQHPAAFPLDSAELTLAWEQRGAAGELWRTTLLLRGRVVPAEFVLELPAAVAAADASLTAGDTPALLAECERELCAVDWLALISGAADPRSQNRVLGWQDASGAPFRCREPGEGEGVPSGFGAQSAALAGVRATIAVQRGDQLLLLSVSVPEAWTWARLRANGGARPFLHQSLWVLRAGRELPPHSEALAGALPERFHLLLDSTGLRPARENFGSTMLRVLATPFACAADLAGGFLVFAFACATAGSDDDAGHRR